VWYPTALKRGEGLISFILDDFVVTEAKEMEAYSKYGPSGRTPSTERLPNEGRRP
jgi:hypothetical protein